MGKFEPMLLTERKRRPENILLDFVSIKQAKKSGEKQDEKNEDRDLSS